MQDGDPTALAAVGRLSRFGRRLGRDSDAGRRLGRDSDAGRRLGRDSGATTRGVGADQCRRSDRIRIANTMNAVTVTLAAGGTCAHCKVSTTAPPKSEATA